MPNEAVTEAQLEDPGAPTSERFHDAQTELEQDAPEEVDWEDDPLVSGPTQGLPPNWSREYFAQFVPRKATETDGSSLRKQMRDLLTEIEQGPPDFDRGEGGESLTEWLQKVEDKVHLVGEFVAGSFGRHVAAWEELLENSTRTTSKSALL
jgi:hypothetical protein